DMETGFRVMGLNNRGVGFAMDEHNAGLVSDAMAASTYKAAYDIATGAVSVHDYMSDDSCPNLSF
ncbi:MAG: BMP family ABC transporter substrate-binding protein, partial [Paracoccaceae bacterium]